MAQGRAERAAANENKKLKLPQLQTRSSPPTSPRSTRNLSALLPYI